MDMPRKHQHWSDAELEKLRSLAGNRPADEIAQELGRPRRSVTTKAHRLKVSLGYVRRRQQRNVGAERQRT
jgi:hypothetical protein